MTLPSATPALDCFRRLVLSDEALQQALAGTTGEAFVALALAFAQSHGIALPEEDLRAAIATDPLGIERMLDISAPMQTSWPAPAWRPIRLAAAPHALFVDWARFAGPPTDPFFATYAAKTARQPLNVLLRWHTTLEDFLSAPPGDASAAPNGFIFHLSRCGSTLVSQCLAAVARNVVVSEAPPLDSAVQLAATRLDAPIDVRVRLVERMVRALGRVDGERRYFVKTDCWQIMFLPLFRAAFAATPWIFIYRDPIEVMVSLGRMTGPHMNPSIIPPALYGIDGAYEFDGDEYRAQALARICEAASDHMALGGGLLVHYDELPDAIWTKILPHFGIAADEDDLAAMRAAARYDAKQPEAVFSPDIREKQREATPALRALVERRIGPAYRRLEAQRRASG